MRTSSKQKPPPSAIVSIEYARVRDVQRLAKITGEFASGFSELMTLGSAVTVFGSARIPAGSDLYQMGERVGRVLAEAGYAVVTGGGPGLMEAVNRGAFEAAGESVGIGIELPLEPGLNGYLTRGLIGDYFFVRKVLLVKYSRAFVALPGGLGTLDEIAEAATLMQTGKIPHFPIVLLGKEYWSGLFEWMKDRMVGGGTISPEDMNLFTLTDDPDEMVRVIQQSQIIR